VENIAPTRLLKSRQGSIAVGIGALVLAAILLLVYLNHYRNSVKSSGAPVTVLVAKSYVPKGTPFDTLARGGLFTTATVAKSDLRDGAVTDAGALRGQVSIAALYPSQQLTVADFGPVATSTGLSGSSDLTGKWRAISISLDPAHGVSPQTLSGDHVDVYVYIHGIMGLLMPNVLVLAAPSQSASGAESSSTGANFVFRVGAAQVPRFTYAAQNGQIWLALRPANGAKPTPPKFVGPGSFSLR
jgi:Flp pilus assembly protein CpaB